MKFFPTLIFFGVGNFFWIFGGFVHIVCMGKMNNFFMKTFNKATVVEYTVFAFILLGILSTPMVYYLFTSKYFM